MFMKFKNLLEDLLEGHIYSAYIYGYVLGLIQDILLIINKVRIHDVTIVSLWQYSLSLEQCGPRVLYHSATYS